MPAASISNDYVFVIDGSDSFDKPAGTFEHIKKWAAELIKHLASHENCAPNSTVTLVQFSGIKDFGKTYEPGDNGAALKNKDGVVVLKHYTVEIDPTKIDNNASKLAAQAEADFEHLDGNGQLFLCLQDVSMKNFQEKIAKANGSSNRKTTLIVVTDEEWDIEGTVTKESVCQVSFCSIISGENLFSGFSKFSRFRTGIRCF